MQLMRDRRIKLGFYSHQVPYEVKQIVKVPVHVDKPYPVEKVRLKYILYIIYFLIKNCYDYSIVQIVKVPVHVKVENPVPYEVKGNFDTIFANLIWSVDIIFSSLKQSQNHIQSWRKWNIQSTKRFQNHTQLKK